MAGKEPRSRANATRAYRTLPDRKTPACYDTARLGECREDHCAAARSDGIRDNQ